MSSATERLLCRDAAPASQSVDVSAVFTTLSYIRMLSNVTFSLLSNVLKETAGIL